MSRGVAATCEVGDFVGGESAVVDAEIVYEALPQIVVIDVAANFKATTRHVSR